MATDILDRPCCSLIKHRYIQGHGHSEKPTLLPGWIVTRPHLNLIQTQTNTNPCQSTDQKYLPLLNDSKSQCMTFSGHFPI